MHWLSLFSEKIVSEGSLTSLTFPVVHVNNTRKAYCVNVVLI